MRYARKLLYVYTCNVIQTQIVDKYDHINAQYKLFKTAYLNTNMRCMPSDRGVNRGTNILIAEEHQLLASHKTSLQLLE